MKKTCHFTTKVAALARFVGPIGALGFAALLGCQPGEDEAGLNGGEDGSNGPGGKADLVDMAQGEKTPLPDFHLRFADDNGIAYSAFKVLIAPKLSARQNYTVEVDFSSLTKAQYDLLMSYYGGEGFVPWEESRASSYQLVDFLPVKIQALVNHWLIVTSEKIDIPADWRDPRDSTEGPVTVVTGMNCWDTAYSVLFDINAPLAQKKGAIFHIGPLTADKAFKERAAVTFSKDLTRDEIFAATSATRNKDLAVGDMLFIDTKASLIGPAHVALWIDEDLYFEKINFSSEHPIRLALFADVVGPYLEQDDADQPVAMTFFRYRGGEPLQNPSSYTNKYPYPGMGGTSTLPNGLSEQLIFDLDAGLSGSLNQFSIGRLMFFPLAPDPQTKRASYQGADQVAKSLNVKNVCEAKSAKFRYTIDKNLVLYVLRAEDGTEVAHIQGTYGAKTATIKENGAERQVTSYMQFTSGSGTTINVHEATDGLYALNHPGFAEGGAYITCLQDPPYLGSVFKP